jgi:predicted negative regulator of RcsB-dependent stress response
MFTAAFASVAIIGAIFYDNDWALLFSNLILAGAFLTAYRFYPGYVKEHTEKIASLYRNEIDEWESKYPEISFETELA